jgi:hypothetical protein
MPRRSLCRIAPVFTLLASLLGACQGPTGVGAADARFDGSWTYRAEQSGAALTVEGELVIAGADIGRISGSLDAQQVDALGERVPFSGLVAGIVTASGVARLEISLPSGRRRTHLVQVRGDSLIGDWIESGSTPASGTFRASRGVR